MRRILGIDPGSRITGYGVIESDGRKSVHIASGCIKLGQGALPERLGEIYRAVSQVIQEYAPTEMAVKEGDAVTVGQTLISLEPAHG